jgi:hypothetical protein
MTDTSPHIPINNPDSEVLIYLPYRRGYEHKSNCVYCPSYGGYISRDDMIRGFYDEVLFIGDEDFKWAYCGVNHEAYLMANLIYSRFEGLYFSVETVKAGIVVWDNIAHDYVRRQNLAKMRVQLNITMFTTKDLNKVWDFASRGLYSEFYISYIYLGDSTTLAPDNKTLIYKDDLKFWSATYGRASKTDTSQSL